VPPALHDAALKAGRLLGCVSGSSYVSNIHVCNIEYPWGLSEIGCDSHYPRRVGDLKPEFLTDFPQKFGGQTDPT
jgi:hypothetical protein